MAKYSVKIPFTRSIKVKDRQKIADAFLTHIIGRTLAGYDKENERFAGYTKQYAEFKGVGRRDVDLTLSGEMLDQLKVLKIDARGVEIGYRGSKELIGKVEGNILGTYGQPDPIPGKARDFLGIDDNDAEMIVEAYADEDLSELTEEELDIIAREAAREILGDIDFFGDDDGEA
jgi:hypothetical protein